MTMAALVLHPNTVSGASQPFPHHSFSTEPSQPGNPAACAGQAIVEPSRTRLRAILPRPGAACHGEKRAAPDDAPAGLEPPRKYLATSPPQTPPPSVATGSALTPGAPCVGSTAPIPVQPAVSATRAIGPNQRSVMAKPSVLGSLFAAPSVPRPLHSPPPAPGATPSSFSATPPPPLLAPRASYDPLAFARGMQALHGTALGRLMHTAPDIVVDGIPRRLLVPTPGSTAAKLGLLAPSVAPVLLPPAAPAPSLAAAAGHALPCAPTSSSGSHSWRYQLSTEATAQAENYASWSSAGPSPPSQLAATGAAPASALSPTASSGPVAWAPPSSWMVAAPQTPSGYTSGAAAITHSPATVDHSFTQQAVPSAQVFPQTHGSAEWPRSMPAASQPAMCVSLSACSDDATTASPPVSHSLPPLLPLSTAGNSQTAREPWPLERNQSVTSRPAIQLIPCDTTNAATAPLADSHCLPPSTAPASFPNQAAGAPPSRETTAGVKFGDANTPPSPLHTFLTLAPPSKRSPLTASTNPSPAEAASTPLANEQQGGGRDMKLLSLSLGERATVDVLPHASSKGEEILVEDEDSLAVESLLLIRAL
ncbi:hypothetical protein CLOM_g12452 [Closterium sp. NIES-68]|nr:hypothetical protein CLOM_g12452 [Closterium sp. NIES-68]GJP72519.1 hypothetical protein CLOP_g3247 [Closterium sp. NIES-67]